MSGCLFIAADIPMCERKPENEYPVIIDLDNGIVDDGNADDNYRLYEFSEVEYYCDREYGVVLEWNYTNGRAIQVMNYIKQILNNTDSVELWNVWLMDYYEYNERPLIHRREISIFDLTIEDIKEIDQKKHWKSFDDIRPHYYCLEIVR